MNAPYELLLRKLLAQQTQAGAKAMTLANTHSINAAFGYPDKAYPIIHVAGTNGKGSVVTKIANALQHSGYRVGKYTSPHLSCFRERIQVDGEMISEEDIFRLLTKGFLISEKAQIEPSFFELTTCVAFRHFAEQKVDVAVVEVGLGGRLDATNIIEPVASVITSISLDHTYILGNTREAIAAEKGGIIKPGIPVIVGPKAELEILKAMATDQHSPYYAVQEHFSDYDSENSAIARKALAVLDKVFPCPPTAIEEGISLRPSCRMEFFPIGNGVVIDVAHNPDGVTTLLKSMQALYPNKQLRIVSGFSHDKEVDECLRLLKSNQRHLHLVAAKHDRAMDIDMLALKAHSVIPGGYTVHASVAEGIKNALENVSQNEIVLICGSFFLIHEARQALDIPQTSDPFDLNEKAHLSKEISPQRSQRGD